MREEFLQIALSAAERGWVPDVCIRWGIRRLCAERLAEEEQRADHRGLTERMARGPVAPLPEKANEQHYEVPAAFYRQVLGPRLKYSCCFWDEVCDGLREAEEQALDRTCERAQIENGQDILELGCGWGSLSLWMAERYSNSRILAVSNSQSQRDFILDCCRERGLRNLEVVTADMNEFSTGRRFDRVVSVEMFEHMRNYEELLRRVSTWMKPGAKLFIHVFCNRRFAYEFEPEGAANWLGRHFFTAGLMPSEALLPAYQENVRLIRQWRWSGTHYEKTANAWLGNLDKARDQLMPLFESAYHRGEAKRWLARWRIFLMACAELWGFRGGTEWFVAHYLFETLNWEATTVPEVAALETSGMRVAA